MALSSRNWNSANSIELAVKMALTVDHPQQRRHDEIGEKRAGPGCADGGTHLRHRQSVLVQQIRRQERKSHGPGAENQRCRKQRL